VVVPRLTSPVLAVLLVGGVAACSADAPAAAPQQSSPAAAGAAVFGGTDLAWIEINIAMNEELVPLLDLAPAHSHDDAMRALAMQVRRFHDDELTALRSLHDEARLPTGNPHKGMPMPGMVTPAIVAQAARTEGQAFDRLLRQHLTAHLEQGLQLAQSESRSGREPRSKALATEMIADREAYLTKIRGSAR
jgi:uncharacterized protein (DUF305 family)